MGTQTIDPNHVYSWRDVEDVDWHTWTSPYETTQDGTSKVEVWGYVTGHARNHDATEGYDWSFKVELQLNSNSWITVLDKTFSGPGSAGNTGDAWEHTWSSLDPASYNVRVRYSYRLHTSNDIDSYGKGDWDDLTTTYDSTPPDVAFSPESGDFYGKDFSVTVTASDDESGIDTVEYSWSKDTSPGEWTTFSNGEALTQTEPGEWYLHIRATDNTGNTDTTYSGVYKLNKGFRVYNGSSFVVPEDYVKIYNGDTWDNTDVHVYIDSSWVKKFGG